MAEQIASFRPCRVMQGELEKNMTKIANDIYFHRGYCIFKDGQGIWVENHLELFPTWNDAREFINKMLDSTNKTEPRIIGEWKEQVTG